MPLRLAGVGLYKSDTLGIMLPTPAVSTGSSWHLQILGGSLIVEEAMVLAYTMRPKEYPTVERPLPALAQSLPCFERQPIVRRSSCFRPELPQEPSFNGPLLNEVMLKEEFGSRFVPPVQSSQADEIPPEVASPGRWNLVPLWEVAQYFSWKTLFDRITSTDDARSNPATSHDGDTDDPQHSPWS
jgi:hypothetical protein